MNEAGFERQKWEAELRLREREIAVKEREVAIKEQETAGKDRKGTWANPLVIAVLAAAAAAAGNAGVALINGTAQRELEVARSEGLRTIEETKAEAARILEVIKTDDPDKAAANLDFLLKAGLIIDKSRRAELDRFLKQRQPGAGPSIPPSAAAPRSLTQDERRELLGGPSIQEGQTGDAAISLGDPWFAENIVTVSIPQLRGVATMGGAPSIGNVRFHRAAAPALQAVFAELESQGLLSDIRSFDGSFSPRIIRGSPRTLSAHALGIAIDMNVRWNAYGNQPAAEGTEGSLLRVVPVFERHGFVWGGRWSRPDGGHFEFADRELLRASR